MMDPLCKHGLAYLCTIITALVLGFYLMSYTSSPHLQLDVWSPELIAQLKTSSQELDEQRLPEDKTKWRLFDRRLTAEDEKRVFTILDTLHKISIEKNLTYFIAMKTLLGSYRHHDLIPWDDHIDILVLKDHKDVFIEELAKNVDYIYNQKSQDIARISLTYGRRHPNVKRAKDGIKFGYTFPFVGVYYFTLNSHVINHNHNDIPCDIPRDIIFPLALRPLNKKLYFGPHDPRRYFRAQGYNMDNCSTEKRSLHGDFFHNDLEQVTVPCATLINKFPFVQHIRGPGGAWCQEVLIFGTTFLSDFSRSTTNITDC